MHFFLCYHVRENVILFCRRKSLHQWLSETAISPFNIKNTSVKLPKHYLSSYSEIELLFVRRLKGNCEWNNVLSYTFQFVRHDSPISCLTLLNGILLSKHNSIVRLGKVTFIVNFISIIEAKSNYVYELRLNCVYFTRMTHQNWRSDHINYIHSTGYP